MKIFINENIRHLIIQISCQFIKTEPIKLLRNKLEIFIII